MNPTSVLIPPRQHRPTTVLAYDDTCDRLGERPLEHLRHQLAGLHRLSPRERLVIALTIGELRSVAWPLHYRDVQASITAHLKRTSGLPGLSDDEFFTALQPAVGLLVSVSWDRTWGAAAA